MTFYDCIAAKKLGVSSENCMAFEDALSGVIAATSAGMVCVACPDERLDSTAFNVYTPFVIKSLAEFDCNRWNFLPTAGVLDISNE